MLISPTDVVIRLVLITTIAGLIGLEREYRERPAGLRTNIMVGLGATLITIAAIRILDVYPGLTQYTASHVISTILTGIGFIGAGAILRPDSKQGGSSVVGLTTAATMWVVTGLGIAVGMGLYLEAVVTTLLTFFTMLVIGRWVAPIRAAGSKADNNEE